jgi:aminoglycoside phosphotransferase (APT) family kinase protein
MYSYFMSESISNLNLEEINRKIADRSDVFYWQTDRAVEPREAGEIWADRHRYFTDQQLVEALNSSLEEDKLVGVEPLDLEAQTNLGNVNSVRVGKLTSGKEVILRCHPRGVQNGYFHVEATASSIAKSSGLPSFNTLAVHDFEGHNDFAFHVLEKLPGTAIKKWLEANPDDEAKLMTQAGRMMARLHQIKVSGYGPFDNDLAKDGILQGMHGSFAESVRAGLTFNLDVLQREGILTHDQSVKIDKIFEDDNPLLQSDQAVLVHNDFADWNLLTDGNDITGILDWDECVASDPVSDIACWSTFFEPERLAGFLDGYWQVAEKPANFNDKFELMRLRYVLSKMTLRIRRYSWEPSESMKEKIRVGKLHLADSLTFFEV